MKTILVIKLIIILLLFPLLANAKQQEPIKLGMSAAFSGPSGELGVQLKQGAEAFFKNINKSGGINGRKVQLLTLDDKYEPELTVMNTRQFLNQDKVDALFTYVGTPTSNAIQSIIDSHAIPYITPFSGADLLRHNPLIFNLRASYNNEAEVQIEYLVKELGLTRIAFLIQADEFGLSVQDGLDKALSPFDLAPIKVARFKRNSNDIEDALAKLKKVKPQAICLVGTYKPLADFINLAAEQNFTPQFTSVSFVSSKNLFERLKQSSNVLVTEVMPSVEVCKEAWCHRFKETMKSVNVGSPTRVHLEGYANAFTFYNAAKNCVSLTKKCLLTQLSSIKKELDETPRNFVNESQKIAGSTVFLNHYQHAKWHQ